MFQLQKKEDMFDTSEGCLKKDTYRIKEIISIISARSKTPE